MRCLLLIILILVIAVSPFAQSRRVSPGGAPAAVALELSIKQMFDEANGYLKLKFAEFEQKKIGYSERLRLQTEREQKQLAAKYATAAATRTDLSGEDLYYVGLLNWLAGNLDSTAEFLKKFNGKPCRPGFRYNSGENTDWLSVDELRQLIKQHVDPNFKA